MAAMLLVMRQGLEPKGFEVEFNSAMILFDLLILLGFFF